MASQDSASDFKAQQSLLSNVAVLYYKEGLTQSQISQRIGVSRASVVNYLRQAREVGIVDIRIRGSAFAATSISRELCQKYQLEDVYIARDDDEHVNKTEKVAQIGAMAVFDLLSPGDRLGVSWGQTVHMVATAFPHRPISDLTVCQILGSVSTPNLPAAEDCTIRLANATSARCVTLHAPAIVSNAKLAAQLRSEPIISSQLANLKKLNKVLFSISNMDSDTLMVSSGICDIKTMKRYAKAGAKGVLCGRFIDAQGEEIPSEISERMIGIDLPTFKKIPMRMLVSNGQYKIDPIKAALKSGYVTHLVIDEGTALKLLS